MLVGMVCACTEAEPDEAPTFSAKDEPAADGQSDGQVDGSVSDSGAFEDAGADPLTDTSGPCQGDEMCSPEQFCLNGQCRADVCAPGSAKCSNLTVKAICMDSGAGYISEDCAEKETCEDGSCKPSVCSPGKKICVDNQVVTCGARGVSWKDPIKCGDKATCIEAVCVPLICAKGELKCAGNTLMSCKGDGTGWQSTPCKSGHSCDGAADTPKCVKQVCVPKAGYCDGNQAMLCSPNGLNGAKVADCSKPSVSGKKQKCLSGKCVPFGCVPGDTICQEGMLGTCVKGGSGYSLEQCPKNKVCDGGDCKDQICVPGEVLCDGKLVKTCIDGGTALAVIGKCGADQACVGEKGKAQCVQQVCTPTDKKCNKAGTGIDVCKSNGLGTTSYDCPDGQVCDKAACVKWLCDPSSLYCSMDWVMKCNIVGSSADKVEQCKPDQFCKAGKCVAKLCTPGQAVCKNVKTLSVCDDPAKGLSDLTCKTGKVCNLAKCVPQVCKPNSKFCEGSQVMHCDANGLSKLMNLNCNFQNKSCKDGGCVAPQCGNGKIEPGEQCDDGNNKPGDGCSPTCTKEEPSQCAPGSACCTNDGKWQPKGSKCSNFSLVKKYSCSSPQKGAKVRVSSGYPSCKGNSKGCDYVQLWWSPTKDDKTCPSDKVCKVAPGASYAWCGM